MKTLRRETGGLIILYTALRKLNGGREYGAYNFLKVKENIFGENYMQSIYKLAIYAFFIVTVVAAAHAQITGGESLSDSAGDKVSGAWRINYAESDDTFSKMQKVLQDGIVPPDAEKNSVSKENAPPAMSVSLVPPETLVLVDGEKSATLNEEFNSLVLTRTFITDGKNRIGEVQGVNFLATATRSAGSLKIEIVSPRGNKMTETYTSADDGKKLIVTVRFETARAVEIVTLRRVYDRSLIEFSPDDAEQIQ